MKTLRTRFTEFVSYFFILLFCYASISKMMDFENFQIQIGQSPLLSAYAGVVSYSVIIVEILISILLIFERTRIPALYAATALMSAFTIYIYLILNYSDFVPCSCGGILEDLGWTEHLIFNISCVILGAISVMLNERNKTGGLRRSIFLLLISNFLSCILVVALFFSSEHIIKKENNFTRRFLIHPVIEENKLDLKVNSYYFAGEHNGNIFLGNYTSPFTLSIVDNNFKTIQQYQLIPPKSKLVLKKLKTVVRFPFVYLSDGSAPIIYRARLGSSALNVYSFKDFYFNDYVVPDSTSIVFRAKSAKSEKHILGLLKIKDSKNVVINNDMILSDGDGVFSTDGKLLYSSDADKLIFIHYYKNAFTISNPDFSHLQHLKTIDTINSTKLKIVTLQNGHRKMAAPPMIVNVNASAYGNVLFNQSNIKGKFESQKLWKRSSVVDMYDISKQEYFGSFYISNQNNSGISQMLATQKYFYTITGNEIVRYRYAQSVSKHFQTGKAENLKKE